MRKLERAGRKQLRKRQAGFSLLEMMVAMGILLAVAAIVMQAMLQMINVQGSLANRSEMHSSIRSATELLQQEIGQAGKVSLPPLTAPLKYLMTTPVVVPSGSTGVTVPVVVTPSTTGMFNGEYLVIDVGNDTTLPGSPDKQETVQISGLTASGFTATFTKSHLASVPITLQGAFGTGVVPPDPATIAAQGITGITGQTNGSTGYVLKLYGDTNGDGNMVYIEYVCDVPAANLGNPLTVGNLYRNVTAYDAAAAAKPPRNSSMVVLNNLLDNPLNAGVRTPCFTYFVKALNIGATTNLYVVNVAITLTAQTTLRDPQTHQFQQESKALLNVSPRNVFQAWMLSSAMATDRVQPMPASIYDPVNNTGLITTTP